MYCGRYGCSNCLCTKSIRYGHLADEVYVYICDGCYEELVASLRKMKYMSSDDVQRYTSNFMEGIEQICEEYDEDYSKYKERIDRILDIYSRAEE